MKASKYLEPKQRKTFRDKYLAVILAVAALFITSIVSAQTDELKYSKINGYGFTYKRWGADSILMAPLATSPHTPYRAGGIKYDPADSTHLLVYTGSQWLQVGDNGTPIDTAYYEDPFLSIVSGSDTFNIDLSAVSMVDSVKVFKHAGTDSVFTKVNETETFSFVDNNNFPTAHTFNTATGIFTTLRNGLTDLTIDLDGRYIESLAQRNDSVFSYKNGVETFVAVGHATQLTDSTFKIGADTITIRGTGGGGGSSIVSSSSFTQDFTGGDSLYRITTVSADGSTTITQDSNGIRIQRATNSANVWDNRLVFTDYGQTWTNTYEHSITFVPNFDPSTTVRTIGIGITTMTDNELWPVVGWGNEYFAFTVKLGQDSATSGYQGEVHNQISANSYYARRFYSGLIWKKGDVIKLTVRESDRNQYMVTVLNLSRNSKISAYLNFPLPNEDDQAGTTPHAGYPSIFCKGGDFTVKNHTFDPLTAGVQLVWVDNSIGYGYGLDSLTNNNNYYTYFNIIKNELPFKSVLMGMAAASTDDVNRVMKEIALYKPRYVVLGGIESNDWFVSTDPNVSEEKYMKIVKRLKAQGINVIHVVPAPRGDTNPSPYGTFHSTIKDWIISTFPNDIIINDFDSLLAPGTSNTLNPAYYSSGDGTHLNNAGHAKRADDFLKQIQFDFLKGSVTRSNADTLNAKKIYNDSLWVNAYSLFNGNIKARGASAFNTIVINDSDNINAPLDISGNVNGFLYHSITNSHNSVSAGVGLLYTNDIGSVFQLYKGGSTAGFVADGVILRESGSGGMKFSTDAGKFYWEPGAVINASGDSSHIAMELDASTLRLKKPKLAIGTQVPTAYLHIKAGTATAGTAPLKFSAGTNLTTPENGAFEFDGSHFYGTVGSTRYQLDQQTGSISGSGTSGRIAYWNGSSSLTSNSNFLFNGSVLSVGTTNTQGQLNIGGNKDLSSSGAQSYFASATYTDQVTAASGTASSYLINYIAAPTIAAANTGVAFPSITTLAIDAPVAGTNATLTNRYALLLAGTGANLGVNGYIDGITHLRSTGTGASITSGTGAGTIAGLSVTGGDAAGKIDLTAGTTPATSATVVTITFASAYAAAPVVILTPGNAAAAALTGGTQVYVSSTSTTNFIVTSGSSALTDGVEYIWYYHVIQ